MNPYCAKWGNATASEGTKQAARGRCADNGELRNQAIDAGSLWPEASAPGDDVSSGQGKRVATDLVCPGWPRGLRIVTFLGGSTAEIWIGEMVSTAGALGKREEKWRTRTQPTRDDDPRGTLTEAD